MEKALFRLSTPVSRPQVSRPQFSQDPNLEGSRAPIEELLSPEVIAEVREELKRYWFIIERDQYRLQLKHIWSPPHPLHPEYEMLRLDSIPQKRGHRNRADRSGLVILGSIWNAWFDALGREPHIQLDEFFAVPGSVGENDAKTISEILRAPKYICAQVRGTLEEKRAGAEIALSKTWQDPRYFKLHPLCEALIAVFDEYNFVAARKHADGFRHYDDVAQNQSILLVRTGHEDKLSAPISFDSLKHKALPLTRSEDMGIIDIIRVPLQVGVRFVANLLLREEAAFPESVLGGPHISKELDHPFMKWEREALDWEKTD